MGVRSSVALTLLCLAAAGGATTGGELSQQQAFAPPEPARQPAEARRLADPKPQLSLPEKGAQLTAQLGLEEGLPLVEIVDRAVRELELGEQVEGLSLIKRLDACLNALGVTASTPSPQTKKDIIPAATAPRSGDAADPPKENAPPAAAPALSNEQIVRDRSGDVWTPIPLNEQSSIWASVASMSHDIQGGRIHIRMAEGARCPTPVFRL